MLFSAIFFSYAGLPLHLSSFTLPNFSDVKNVTKGEMKTARVICYGFHLLLRLMLPFANVLLDFELETREYKRDGENNKLRKRT